MTKDNDMSWQDRLNLIWNRAHIPEYANDAKLAINGLIQTLLDRQREDIAREVEKELKEPDPEMVRNGKNRDYLTKGWNLAIKTHLARLRAPTTLKDKI